MAVASVPVLTAVYSEGVVAEMLAASGPTEQATVFAKWPSP